MSEVSSKYSPSELYDKVDWEGGLFETAFGYGIESDDIDDSTELGARLKDAWAKMELEYRDHFAPAIGAVQGILFEIEDGRCGLA